MVPSEARSRSLCRALFVDGVTDLVERGDGALRVPLSALAGDRLASLSVRGQ